MNRDLVRSAKARALIVAALLASPRKTAAEIGNFPEVTSLHLTKKALYALLYRMDANGLIIKETTPEGQVVYRAGSNSPGIEAKAIREVGKAVRKQPHINPADLKVDILKAAGRIRLTMNGFTIDIGIAT